MNGDVTEPEILSVAAFSDRLKGWFRNQRSLNRIGIVGEISEWRSGASGVGFSLKDRGGLLKCFAFSDAVRAFPKIEDGMAVTAIGTVEVKEKWGIYQLLVRELRISGQGERHQEFLALKEKFRLEGLFEDARKKALPAFPLHIAVVKPAQAKGADDFIIAMRAGAPFVRLTFVETRMQLEGAEIEIAEAIDVADRRGADVIVIARGGGTYEDLFPFNLEPVVRAIVRARTPVVTAVAHTGDHHLADEVADRTFGTPSLAAGHFVKGWNDGRARLKNSVARLEREIESLRSSWYQRIDEVLRGLSSSGPAFVDRQRTMLARRERVLAERSPQRRVSEMGAGLGKARTLLGAATRRAIDIRNAAVAMRAQRLGGLRERPVSEKRRTLERLDARLTAASPEGPLERGYAILTFAGKPLNDVRNVQPGAEIAARLWRGSLTARVESTNDE